VGGLEWTDLVQNGDKLWACEDGGQFSGTVKRGEVLQWQAGTCQVHMNGSDSSSWAFSVRAPQTGVANCSCSVDFKIMK
jgi:hypothetical protein